MAIGLGRMFGFRFLENFNYPYISKSIQEFWRRWHISLSSWFRDYLYIPLGGNRNSPARTYFNLIIVFLLCGLWHGASWNFIIWGLIHGFFLILERSWLGAKLDNSWRFIRHAYTLFVVTIAWVFFRAETLPDALSYLSSMFALHDTEIVKYSITGLLTHEAGLALLIGLLLSAPIYTVVTDKLKSIAVSAQGTAYFVYLLPKLAVISILLILSLSKVASSTYNPFIYFRF